MLRKLNIGFQSKKLDKAKVYCNGSPIWIRFFFSSTAFPKEFWGQQLQIRPSPLLIHQRRLHFA